MRRGIFITAEKASQFYWAMADGCERGQADIMETFEEFQDYLAPEDREPIPDGAMTPPGYDYETGDIS